MNLLDQVRATIRWHALAGPDTRVLVAVSGGSDSVALAHLLRAAADAGALQVAGVAHFNHQLRPAAAGDEAFCAELAGSFGWPFLVGREDVAARARRERKSIEDAARTARHAFLERARAELGADVVALGHTRDDQAETVLLRLLRGAGRRGLGAMHPRRGAIIRPLLESRRDDLRAYLEHAGVAHRHDESNEDVAVPRNRIRAELLPFLQDRFNPAVVDVLADTAEIAREEWDWLDSQAAALSERICRTEPAGARLDAGGLAAAHPALARIVIRQAMLGLSNLRPVEFRHVQQVLDLSRLPGPPFDAPGQRVERIGDFVVLTSRDHGGRRAEPLETPGSFCYPLPVPGVVECVDGGWALSAETFGPDGSGGDDQLEHAKPRNARAVLQLECCRGPFSVRSRRPGDAFRPLGLGGRKKLQDFFVDRKVTRSRRDAVPLVVDRDDRIMWVAGHAIDEAFRVTDASQPVLILNLMQLGGPA